MTVASYPLLDRLLHHVAFGGSAGQLGLADLEDRLFRQQLESVPVDRPVFITSLPRAGTTLLLEVLSGLPEFATHTYRNMPFILCPMLWDRLSRVFRKRSELRERAHGDGVVIGFDSSEAFEEILWMQFWEHKYQVDRIHPWSGAERSPDFEQFFIRHMRKILALEGEKEGASAPARYLSKNNANIARMDLLTAIFPDCRIVVPFRNPWDHVRSLRHQHQRFKALHAEDAFSRRYMEWLGHFEFGQTLRPIDFNGWTRGSAAADPGADIFWLTYWAEAAEALLRAAGRNVCFFDYDRACREPESTLAALARFLGVRNPTTLARAQERFRPPTHHTETISIAPELETRLEWLHDALTQRAL